MSLYLWINILTLAGPLALSFDKKVGFYKKWKFVIPAILIVGILFLIWDEIFTNYGIWGFNPEHLQGIYIGHLPLEEVLFFLTVPYACIFVFECIKCYFPKIKLNNFGYGFAFIFTLLSITLAVIYSNNWYTFYALFGAGILNAIVYFGFTPKWYGKFALAFLICIIPFCVVNGILTGYFTETPVVWYNEEHIMGPRIGTIPFEDLFYNFFMLFPIAGIYQTLSSKKKIS